MHLHFSIIDFGTPQFDESIALRDLVLRKPLKLSFTTAQISKEYNSLHLAAYNSSFKLLACLVLEKSTEGYKMRQVAVAPKHQGMGIGGQLVKFSEDIVNSLKAKKIYLHARDTAVPFYIKHKYQITGKPFEEVGIEHYKMYKEL